MPMRSYRLTQIAVYLSCLVMAVLLIYLYLALNRSAGNNALYYYSSFVSQSFEAFMQLLFLPYVFFLFLSFSVFWAKSGLKKVDPGEFFNREIILKKATQIKKGFIDLMVFGAPVGLCYFLLCFVLGQLNFFNSGSLVDAKVLSLDRFFTGTYPFIAFSNLHYPSWLLWMIRASFEWLAPIVIFFVICLLYFRRDVFHEMAAALCISMVALLFFWWNFPVLSPHDRFIDNVYHSNITSTLKAQLLDYSPQPQIQNFLDKIRGDKDESLQDVYPTSTIPSAHVVWATLLFYYSWKISRRLFIVLGSIAVLSSIGTFLFAQHYFVDLPTGIILASLTIMFSAYLNKKDRVVFATSS